MPTAILSIRSTRALFVSTTVAAMMSLLLAAGCTPTGVPDEPTATITPSGGNGGEATSATSADPTRPAAGASETIYVQTFTGVAHREMAERLKQQLSAGTPLSGWYVVSSDDQSILYHGFYASGDKQLRRDEEAIQALKNRAGDPLFRRVIAVPLESPDPDAPAAWNLENTDGFWTVEVGTYIDHPDRKRAAVDAVRAAREMGVEAYYYHGPNASSVTIGAWPRSAVREQRQGSAGSAASDPDRVVVVSTIPLSDEWRNMTDQETGRRALVLERKVEIVDPTLLQAMQQYNEHAVNGLVTPGKRSFLTMIPRSGGDTVAPGQPDNSVVDPTLLQPTGPSPSTGGRLRSLGG